MGDLIAKRRRTTEVGSYVPCFINREDSQITRQTGARVSLYQLYSFTAENWPVKGQERSTADLDVHLRDLGNASRKISAMVEADSENSSHQDSSALADKAARLALGVEKGQDIPSGDPAAIEGTGAGANADGSSACIAIPTDKPPRIPVVLDPDNAGRPLAALESTYYNNLVSYIPSEKPDSFKDRYLFPVLTSTEKQRLNRLWYLTKGVESDSGLQDHLESLVSLLKDATGYEMAMVALIDNDVYIRIAADGCPLAVVPRGESTCSHTLVQKPGTVFSIPDMQADWRFDQSPYVVHGGLRSYAGTQLCYRQSESEQPVVLGSLCVASTHVVPPLTELQKKGLIRFAAAIMHALSSRARVIRQGVQKDMNERLSILANQTGDPGTIIEKTLAAIRKTFPGCMVSLDNIGSDRRLSLIGGRSISTDDFQQYLWENDGYIENWIHTSNHISAITNPQRETLRAIAVPVDEDRYLLVETADLRQVFDEIDALFVRSCGMLLSNALQEGLLQRALQAKANFLRDVQHSLRTSLNGILSASEMLLDEAATRTILDTYSCKTCHAQSPAQPSSPHSHNTLATTLPHLAIGSYESLLDIIDSSGRNLVNIINNLLDLDSTSKAIHPKLAPCNLYDLEEEVLEIAMQGSSRSKIARVTLISDNEIPDHSDTLMTDPILLRQVLAILVQNALDATDDGSVIIRSYLNESEDLVVDVVDTGRGIPEEARQRIFDPFEKVNAFSQSAGLGLSFAARYADALHATVQLVTSQVGKGSHFRFRLPRPVFACDRSQPNAVLEGVSQWSYFLSPTILACEDVTIQYVCQGLKRLGCKPESKEAATFVIGHIVTGTPDQDLLAGTSKTQVALGLVPAADFRKNAKTAKFDIRGRLVYCGMPLCRNRLLASLAQVERARAELSAEGIIQRLASEVERVVAPSATRAFRFLLVDDNAMNLNILQAFCKKRKYDYVLAYDGHEAYERFVEAQQSGNPISIVLLDLQMPVCDGIEAMIMIRKYELDNQLKSSLIFMVTGQSGEEEKERAALAGSNGYFVKPLRLKVLDELLATHSM